MAQNRSAAARSRSIIADLARPPRIERCGPIAARFLYSLRLIALHERAGRDSIPELAARLGNVEAAAKALALAQVIGESWPEHIQVSRFCCSFLTHDEATIGAMIDAMCARDRPRFQRAIEGLVRPDRHHRLCESVIALLAAEQRDG